MCKISGSGSSPLVGVKERGVVCARPLSSSSVTDSFLPTRGEVPCPKQLTLTHPLYSLLSPRRDLDMSTWYVYVRGSMSLQSRVTKETLVTMMVRAEAPSTVMTRSYYLIMSWI